MNNQPIKHITRKELSAILRDEKAVQGCTFIGFDALTEMKLNKTLNGDRNAPNPHFGRVFKVLSGQVGMLFSNKTGSAYQNMVNRRLALENKPADFKAESRSWGTRVPNTSFVHHTNKDGQYCEYLSVIYNESPVTLADYVTNDLGIELNEADRALIEAMQKRVVAFESKSGTVEYVQAVVKDGNVTLEPIAKADIQGQPPAKNEGEQGGLSEGMKVIPRDFKLSSLQRITMGGVAYLIED